MSTKKKLSTKEYTLLQKIRKDSVEIASTLGELEYQKIAFDIQIENQKDKIRELKKVEAEFFEDLKNKYGNIVLNVETGEMN